MCKFESNFEVLDKIVALNLDVTLWTGRKKLEAQDLGGVNLPPEDLASLGSKRIADPEKLKVFSTIKCRAASFVSFHSKCKVWGQRTDTVQQFKEPGQRSVPRIF